MTPEIGDSELGNPSLFVPVPAVQLWGCSNTVTFLGTVFLHQLLSQLVGEKN